MFDCGSKVVVLASSLKKGAIGPRKGSIGYTNGPAIYQGAVGLDDRTRLFVGITTITFLRYGFDKSLRREVKDVCTFFPIPSKLKDITREEQIDEFIPKVDLKNYMESIKYSFQNHASGDALHKKAYIMVGMPTCSPTNLCTCEDHEFFCWLDSNLNNHDTIQQLENINGNNNHYIGLNINTAVIKALLDCVYSSGYKNDFYKTMTGGSTIRKDIIETLRKINAIATKRHLCSINNLGIVSSVGKSNININSFYSYFSASVFSAKLPALINKARAELKAILDRDVEDSRRKQYEKIVTQGGELLDNIVVSKNHTSKLASSLLYA